MALALDSRLEPSPLSTGRSSRDVARKPTPGAKQRRPSTEGSSPNSGGGGGAAGGGGGAAGGAGAGAASSPLQSEEHKEKGAPAPGALPFRLTLPIP